MSLLPFASELVVVVVHIVLTWALIHKWSPLLVLLTSPPPLVVVVIVIGQGGPDEFALDQTLDKGLANDQCLAQKDQAKVDGLCRGLADEGCRHKGQDHGYKSLHAVVVKVGRCVLNLWE